MKIEHNIIKQEATPPELGSDQEPRGFDFAIDIVKLDTDAVLLQSKVY